MKLEKKCVICGELFVVKARKYKTIQYWKEKRVTCGKPYCKYQRKKRNYQRNKRNKRISWMLNAWAEGPYERVLIGG